MRQPTQDPSQSTSNLNQPFPFRQRHTACHALRTKYKARVTERESKGWLLLAVCTTRGSSVYAPQLFLSTPRTVPRPPTAEVDGGPQELDSRTQASGSDQTQGLRPAAEQQSSWWRVIHNKMRENSQCFLSIFQTSPTSPVGQVGPAAPLLLFASYISAGARYQTRQ